MKLYNKIGKSLVPAALMITTIFSSCEKDFGDINKSWDNKVYEANIPALYNSIASTMVEPGAAGNLLTSFIYQNNQMAAMYAATGFRMDNFSGAYWNNYYAALSNSRELEKQIAADPKAANMTNVKAMSKVLIAYKSLINTMIYGDMPYVDGGKGFQGSTYYRPAYNTQVSIIKASLMDLKWALENFSTSSTQVSLGASETIFQNDISKWIKFANSIRLRYALVLHNKDVESANPIIAEALTKPLLESGDNYGLYPSSIPNLVLDRGGWYRGNSYIRMGSTMFSAMSSTTADNGSGIYDLRCKIFFEPNGSGKWVPYPQAPLSTTPTEEGNSGVNDPYNEQRLTTYNSGGAYKYSPLNFYYTADRNIPQLFITAAEISFLKAEIYNRGIGGVTANAATAKTHYEQGITESVKFWYKTANSSSVWMVNKPAAAPTALELSTMMANTEVAYDATPANGLKQIYKQLWISLFHQPFEGWTLARRTNYATPSVTLSSSSPGYNIFKIIYPQSEIDGNYDNWKGITGGTDAPTKKLWFMN